MADRIGLSFPATFASTIPFLCAILAAFIANFPVSIFGGLFPPPVFAFMPIYFWCLVRPDLMPAPAVFLIGALQDLLSGGPMGVWSASFVISYLLVERERDTFAGLSGSGAVLGFGGVMILTATSAYFVAAFSYGHFPPMMPLVVQAFVTVILYVPGLWCLNAIHHRLVGALRSDF